MKYISDKTYAAVTARAKDDISKNLVGGEAFAVYQNGKTITGYYGVSDHVKNTPINEKSIYRLASMTKPVTSVAAMRQVEKGLINLDDELSKYIPGFADKSFGKFENGTLTDVQPCSNPIRIYNLLNHTNGLFSGSSLMYYKAPDIAEPKLSDMVKFYADEVVLDFDPGTNCFYSPVAAFDVLAYLVEMTSGKDYETYLREEIFSPIGMCDTTFIPNEEQQSRVVKMHCQDAEHNSRNDDNIGYTFENNPVGYFNGGAGLLSSLGDYLQFSKMLLGKGTLDGVQILKEETVQRMVTLPIEIPNAQISEMFGLGMRVISGENRLPLRSFGWSGAYGTHFFIDVENQLSAVYMKNSRIDGGAGSRTANNFELDIENSLT